MNIRVMMRFIAVTCFGLLIFPNAFAAPLTEVFENKFSVQGVWRGFYISEKPPVVLKNADSRKRALEVFESMGWEKLEMQKDELQLEAADYIVLSRGSCRLTIFGGYALIGDEVWKSKKDFEVELFIELFRRAGVLRLQSTKDTDESAPE